MITYIIEANKGTRNFVYLEFQDKKEEYTIESVKSLYDENLGMDTEVTVKQ